MDVLPIFLKLNGADCLVVGGNEAAARKVELLLGAGARVRLVTPDLGPSLTGLARAGRVHHRAGRFEDADLDRARLVIAASDDGDEEVRVHAAAVRRALPVNVVDRPELCTFVVPSIIDRSPVVAAVSTGGASPVLTRLLRTRLETLVPAAYGRLAALAGRFRGQVKARIADINTRRAFWESVLQGPIAELALSGREAAAERALADALATADPDLPAGEVYLVGAGPGDPDLLTFRALRLMQQADVVVYDRLVSPEVLNLARRDAERIYAGKARGEHAIAQGGINELLVDLARQGRRVLRLKGGDPFIFGRGGEEIDTLASAGVPFQVVPGITAASGCAAYAGIPLTHRDHAQSCVFVTGHLRDGRVNLDWDALIQPRQTIVIYMGLVGLPTICNELIARGLPPATPAALIQQGTTRDQRVFTATLATLAEQVAAAGARAPTLIIVGHVVTLHERLRWFDPRADDASAMPSTASLATPRPAD